ncbi:MAG: copper-binding protein [Magnetococcales bacterium]|nr:copper-binding protein [Magnetococcales bacterium]
MSPLVRLLVATLITWLCAVPAMAGSEQEQKSAKPASKAHVAGLLHTVDAQKRVVNIDHPPIPEFNWPAMRMDFGVAKEANLTALQAGQKVQFTITHSAKGGYLITEIGPAR